MPGDRCHYAPVLHGQRSCGVANAIAAMASRSPACHEACTSRVLCQIRGGAWRRAGGKLTATSVLNHSRNFSISGLAICSDHMWSCHMLSRHICPQKKTQNSIRGLLQRHPKHASDVRCSGAMRLGEHATHSAPCLPQEAVHNSGFMRQSLPRWQPPQVELDGL